MSDEQEKQKLWKLYMIFMGIMVGGGALILTSQWVLGTIQNAMRENDRKTALQNSIATTPSQSQLQPSLLQPKPSREDAPSPTPSAPASPQYTNAIQRQNQARETIISLYALISQKDFGKAVALYSPNLANQFDSTFFNQFQRVTVDELAIISTNENSIAFQGLNTYIWKDGSSQQEKRSFVVSLANSRPKIIASEFIEVLRIR